MTQRMVDTKRDNRFGRTTTEDHQVWFNVTSEFYVTLSSTCFFPHEEQGGIYATSSNFEVLDNSICINISALSLSIDLNSWCDNLTN